MARWQTHGECWPPLHRLTGWWRDDLAALGQVMERRPRIRPCKVIFRGHNEGGGATLLRGAPLPFWACPNAAWAGHIKGGGGASCHCDASKSGPRTEASTGSNHRTRNPPHSEHLREGIQTLGSDNLDSFGVACFWPLLRTLPTLGLHGW